MQEESCRRTKIKAQGASHKEQSQTAKTGHYAMRCCNLMNFFDMLMPRCSVAGAEVIMDENLPILWRGGWIT
jgi:hypothetical protein